MKRRNAATKLAASLVLLSTLLGCNRPTAGETPSAAVPIAEKPTVLFQDDFSDPSGGWKEVWFEGSGSAHGAEYNEGALRVWVDNDENAYDINLAAPGQSFVDVHLEVDVQKVSGTGYSGAHLMCRVDAQAGSFYYFKLDGEGLASIGVYLNGEEMHVVFKEVPAGVLRPDWNRLGASCIGPELAISVNGQTIFDTEEPDLQQGDVGLGAGGDDAGRTEVLFDNFAAYPPETPASSQAAAQTQTVATAEEEALRPFEGDPPPPEGLIDAMAAGVDAGTWTYEQALITNLKIFAGEVRLEDVYDVSPDSLEGFGLVLEATRYLSTGADAVVKAEIERLLGILLPPRERLLEVADPATTAKAGRAGLARMPQPQEDCENLYKKGFPPGSGIKCLLYKESGIGGSKVRTFYPLVALPLEYADAAHAAILKSWTTYSSLKGGLAKVTMGDVDLVFVLLPYVESPTILALVPSLSPDPTCKITVFLGAIQANEKKKSGPNDFGHFQQTIAHEMFHCYQQWNFPDHFPNESDSSDWGVQDWWGEGTAEYFSNVVYPSVNDEWGRILGFDLKSASTPLVGLSYGNTVFFQYMAGLLTNDGLLQLLHQLPYAGTEQDQAAALAAWPDIESRFHDFGRAFFDGKIKDTSGALLPSGPPLVLPDDYLTVFETQIRLLEARPFILKRVGVLFPQGHRYTIAPVVKGALAGLDAVRRGAAGGNPWGEWPLSVAAGCSDETFLMLMTSTAAAPSGKFAIELTLTPAEPLVCDPCVPGKWRLLPESLADFLAAPFAETPGLFEYAGGGGLWIYTFSSTGGLNADVNYALGYNLQQGSETLPLVTQVVLAIEGQGTGSYWVQSPGTLALEGVTSNFKMEQTIAINNQEVVGDSPIPLDPLPPGVTTTSYECSPTTLVLWYALAENAGLPPLAFERIESVP